MGTSYVLLSEMRQEANWGSNGGDPDQIRQWIAEESVHWEEMCLRRFDHRIETRYYTPIRIGRGGHLISSYELRLDDDLISVSALVNGDGMTIDSSDYTLLPLNRPGKNSIRLNPYGDAYWTYPILGDLEGAIQITGVWGHGGTWQAVTGESVQNNPLSNGSTTISVVDADRFEAEMIIRLDSEWCKVTAIDSGMNVITVERAYNGSTAAARNQGTAIYRFMPDPITVKNVKRLVQWRNALTASPLHGQIVVGDMSATVTTGVIPLDVQQAASRLRRRSVGFTSS